MRNLDLPVLSLVERRASIHVFHAIAQYAVDQAGQLGGHGLDRDGGSDASLSILCFKTDN